MEEVKIEEVKIEKLVYDMNQIIKRFGSTHIQFIHTMPHDMNIDENYITIKICNAPDSIISGLLIRDWTFDEFFHSDFTFVEYCQMLCSSGIVGEFKSVLLKHLDTKDWSFLNAMSKCINWSSTKELEMKLQLMGF